MVERPVPLVRRRHRPWRSPFHKDGLRHVLCAGALGSTGTRVLYGDLSQFERAFAEQAARLRRSARPGGSGLRGSDLKKSAVRRVVAGVSARLATGEGLDDQIVPVQRSG